jgi:hypothetical protein
MTENDQRQMRCKSVIASDMMPLSDQMVMGAIQFSHLYDDFPVAVNDDRNASASSTAGTTAVVASSRNAYIKVLKN